METRKKDRGAGRLLVVAFVVVILLAIAFVVISQSGVLPGDVPVDQTTDATIP